MEKEDGRGQEGGGCEAGGVVGMAADQRVLLGFYSAHASSAFSFQLWSFAVPIVFISLCPGDLVPPSVFLVVDLALKILALPKVVSWATAQQHRTQGGRSKLEVLTLLSVAHALLGSLSAGLLVALADRFTANSVQRHAPAPGSFAAYTADESALAIAAVLLGSLGDVACSAASIMREKDWLYDVAGPADAPCPLDTRPSLAVMAATMLQIDLGCKMAARPLLGWIADAAMTSPGEAAGASDHLALRKGTVRWVCGTIIAWNLISLGPALLAYRETFQRFYALQRGARARREALAASLTAVDEDSDDEGAQLLAGQQDLCQGRGASIQVGDVQDGWHGGGVADAEAGRTVAIEQLTRAVGSGSQKQDQDFVILLSTWHRVVGSWHLESSQAKPSSR